MPNINTLIDHAKEVDKSSEAKDTKDKSAEAKDLKDKSADAKDIKELKDMLQQGTQEKPTTKVVEKDTAIEKAEHPTNISKETTAVGGIEAAEKALGSQKKTAERTEGTNVKTGGSISDFKEVLGSKANGSIADAISLFQKGAGDAKAQEATDQAHPGFNGQKPAPSPQEKTPN